MKKYILYILLIFSISIEGRVYQTSDQQVRSIGYTTVDIYDTRIVSTKQDKGINYYGYNPTPRRVYSYQPQTSKTVNTYMHGESRPRKVSGFDGWVTWLTWGQFNGVPRSASNEDMYDYYDYIESGGEKDWNTWYEEKYNPTPIGDSIIPLLILLFFCMLYDLLIRHMLIPVVGQTLQNTRQ